MRSLFWITLLLSTLSASAVLADECDAKAVEIAGQVGLDAGARANDNSIALSARTDEDDDYGAYLLCKGPLGMTLHYLSPPSPGPKWYDFVGRSGTILTGMETGFDRSGGEELRRQRAPARRCIPLAGLCASHGRAA